MLFLTKASDDVVSHCNCDYAPIGEPCQMDCPWCGCGSLFICLKCRQAFTFAKAIEVDLTWEELAHRDLDGKWGRQPTVEEIQEWVDFMKSLLKDLELGKEYVYIDGWVFPTDEQGLECEG